MKNRNKILLAAGGVLLGLTYLALQQPDLTIESDGTLNESASLREKIAESQRQARQMDPSPEEPTPPQPFVDPDEAKELDDFTEVMPTDIDTLPPEIIEDLRRIAESGQDGGVPPHILEELEEQVEAAGLAGSNVNRMAIELIAEAQLAFEKYKLVDQPVVMPDQAELDDMKRRADAQEPTPEQWELLRGPGASTNPPPTP